jgi:hypothetical protein
MGIVIGATLGWLCAFAFVSIGDRVVDWYRNRSKFHSTSRGLVQIFRTPIKIRKMP